MSMNINAVGHLDPTELFKSLYKKVDSSGDGSIDKTEFESAISSMASDQTADSQSIDEMFSKLDTDSNSTVSEDEMMAALKAMGEQRRANMPPPPQAGQNGTGPDFQKMSQDLLSSLDTSGDGGIDKSEFSAGVSALSGTDSTDSTNSEAMFTKLDTNGDGSIDQPELSAGLQNMRPPKPPHQGNGASSNVSSSTDDTTDSSVVDIQSRLFSDFVDSLKSSSGSSDDQISSMFSDLISNLQYGSGYSNKGSLSYSLSSTQSLMSMLA
jgi:Ca2+-binding EF-hand superfamily protein